MIRGNFKHYLKDVITNRVVQAMLLLFMIHFIWLIGTENFQHAKSVIGDMKYLVYPLLFLSFVDKRFFFRVLTAFVVGMLYSEVISYLIHFHILPHQLILNSIELYRASSNIDPSPFLDHSRYTVLLSFTIAILLYNILNNKNTILVTVVSSFFLITATINLSLIGGRIGYISFFVIISFLILSRYRANLFKAILTLIISTFLIFSLFYNTSSLFQQRIDKSINTIKTISDSKSDSNLNSSFGLRLGFWIYSTKIIKDNFLLGVGTGDQLDEVKKIIPDKHSYIKTQSHAHNEYIKTFLQFGLIGFIIFLNIFYQIFKYDTLDKYRKDILTLLSIIILIAIMTSILGSRTYLQLLTTIVSISIAKKSLVADSFKFMDKKTYLLYFGLASLSLIIAVLQ